MEPAQSPAAAEGGDATVAAADVEEVIQIEDDEEVPEEDEEGIEADPGELAEEDGTWVPT